MKPRMAENLKLVYRTDGEGYMQSCEDVVTAILILSQNSLEACKRELVILKLRKRYSLARLSNIDGPGWTRDMDDAKNVIKFTMWACIRSQTVWLCHRANVIITFSTSQVIGVFVVNCDDI